MKNKFQFATKLKMKHFKISMKFTLHIKKDTLYPCKFCKIVCMQNFILKLSLSRLKHLSKGKTLHLLYIVFSFLLL